MYNANGDKYQTSSHIRHNFYQMIMSFVRMLFLDYYIRFHLINDRNSYESKFTLSALITSAPAVYPWASYWCNTLGRDGVAELL